MSWTISRAQSAALRYTSILAAAAPQRTDTSMLALIYTAQFDRVRAQFDLTRDTLLDENTAEGLARRQDNYRLQGTLEYRLRLFIFGADVLYSRAVQESLLGPYHSRQFRIRITRKFGMALR